MRAIWTLAVTGLALGGLALGGCSGNGSSGAGISTASLLDGQAAPGSAEVPQIKNDDAMARPVQVAWTAARAQRCGFNFDAAKLKSNFLASETQRGGVDLAAEDRSYDQTFTTISARIKGEEGYCTEKKSAAIKADLQRHLAGNYEPKLPETKKVASTGFFDGLLSDAPPPEKFDAKNYWENEDAKKGGAKGAQKTD